MPDLVAEFTIKGDIRHLDRRDLIERIHDAAEALEIEPMSGFFDIDVEIYLPRPWKEPGTGHVRTRSGARILLTMSEIFGLKLGWLAPDAWNRASRAGVVNHAQPVTRVIVMTDGFLPDDHRDVYATLEKVRRLGEVCERLCRDEVIPHVLEACAHGHDDATLLVIEPV